MASARFNPSRLEGLALVVLSGLCFSTLPIFNRFAGAQGVGVVTALTFRFVLAAAILWPAALLQGPVGLPWRKLLGFLAMGVLFVLESAAFFVSSRRIPVAITSLLLYLFPGLVMVFSWIIWKERPHFGALLALALALAGIVLAVGRPGAGLDGLGLLLGLVCAVGYAVYVMLGSHLQRGVRPLVASAWCLSSTAVIWLVIGLATANLHPTLALKAWPSILGLAVFGTVLPVFALLAGLAKVTATHASIASTVEPVATAILGAALLGEMLRPTQLAGGAMVITAIALLAMARRT